MKRNLVIGLAGPELTDAERTFLAEHPPLGVILFARNIRHPDQVRALLADVRRLCGAGVWAAIDEEGGRIYRIPWLPFCNRKPAADYGRMHASNPEAARRAVYEDAARTAHALADLGFTHDCAPVLDVFHPAGNAIIGDRAYAGDPAVVADLGAACILGLKAGGIEAIGKHFPGHGRANADSHLALPEVDAAMDVLRREAEPFRALIAQGLGHIMTAHVRYTAVDAEVATLSSRWMQDVLRRDFGFAGRIWTDDLGMKGVGSDAVGAAKRAWAAGCDVLLVCDPNLVRPVYEGLSAV